MSHSLCPSATAAELRAVKDNHRLATTLGFRGGVSRLAYAPLADKTFWHERPILVDNQPDTPFCEYLRWQDYDHRKSILDLVWRDNQQVREWITGLIATEDVSLQRGWTYVLPYMGRIHLSDKPQLVLGILEYQKKGPWQLDARPAGHIFQAHDGGGIYLIIPRRPDKR